MSIPTEAELVKAIAEAARTAITELFREHPGHFYYCSLISSGEAHAPYVTAWSEETLAVVVESEEDREDARLDLRWSYADSPFCGFGAEHFEAVRRLFSLRPQMDPEREAEWEHEYDLRLRAMEGAMALLDSEGLFGIGAKRDRIVVGVEVMPPDFTNVNRMQRLNPPSALTEWLVEAAEE